MNNGFPASGVILYLLVSRFMAKGFKLILSYQNLQKDSSCMFNLEGFIPKACQLAQETGEGEREKSLRAAGLQAISAMVFIHVN